MSTRKIVGFNDKIEFEVFNEQVIRVIDSGSSYKNKLRNGLLLDTLCAMNIQYNDDICKNEVENPLENIKENICFKIKYDVIERPNKYQENEIPNKRKNNKKNEMKNERKNERKNKINTKEKNRRNKRKMLKIGNDYKMKQYQDDGVYRPKVINTMTIPTSHFGKTEIDKYAPLCNDCFVYGMLTKSYHMLYKCTYNINCCQHINCWMCTCKKSYVYYGNKFYCIDCYNNCSSHEKKYYVKIDDTCVIKLKCYSSREECDGSCNCNEEYGYDYGKKYKCRQYFEFSRDTHINHEYHLDQNGNIIIEMYDNDINFEFMCHRDIYLDSDDESCNSNDYDWD